MSIAELRAQIGRKPPLLYVGMALDMLPYLLDAASLLQEAQDKGYLKDKITFDVSDLEQRINITLTKIGKP